MLCGRLQFNSFLLIMPVDSCNQPNILSATPRAIILLAQTIYFYSRAFSINSADNYRTVYYWSQITPWGFFVTPQLPKKNRLKKIFKKFEGRKITNQRAKRLRNKLSLTIASLLLFMLSHGSLFSPTGGTVNVRVVNFRKRLCASGIVINRHRAR